MILTKRDKLIIEILQNQDFCFYKDVCKNFFPSKTSACNRLNKLKEGGYLQIEEIKPSDINKVLDSPSLGLAGKQLKIISLSNKGRLAKRKTSPLKKTHQILLFSVRKRLEKFLEKEAVFENQIRELRQTLHNGKYEPFPDFFIKGEGYKLAVELELSLKSQNRYFQKMIDYRNSRFTHVLYIATHIKTLPKLSGTFRHRKYIAVSHYSNVEQVISHRYGRQSLNEWLKERTK